LASDVLSASLEDYLEAIFHIVAAKQAARAKDISNRLKVNGSSVTGALHALADRALINYAPYDVVTLTPKGKSVAKGIVRRHEALHDFFAKVLGVDEDEAQAAACKMEHAVSPTILDRFIKFLEFVEVCPRSGADWIRGFGRHCELGRNQENCAQCISHCLEALNERCPAAAAKVAPSGPLGEARHG